MQTVARSRQRPYQLPVSVAHFALLTIVYVCARTHAFAYIFAPGNMNNGDGCGIYYAHSNIQRQAAPLI